MNDKELIEDAFNLLFRLKQNGLINKNTTYICLDKSVRPLAFILSSAMTRLKMEKPDFKFINFDVMGFPSKFVETRPYYDEFEKYFDKINLKNKSDVVILDHLIHYGRQSDLIEKRLEKYIEKKHARFRIHKAAITVDDEYYSKKAPTIYLRRTHEDLPRTNTQYTGISEKPKKITKYLWDPEMNETIISKEYIEEARFLRQFLSSLVKEHIKNMNSHFQVKHEPLIKPNIIERKRTKPKSKFMLKFPFNKIDLKPNFSRRK
jgi:hypothetical protein